MKARLASTTASIGVESQNHTEPGLGVKHRVAQFVRIATIALTLGEEFRQANERSADTTRSAENKRQTTIKAAMFLACCVVIAVVDLASKDKE